MDNIFEKIVHKLWMVDHHDTEPDVYIKEIIKRVHYDWLRENLLELKIDSNHIHNENLREFTVETLLKNGFIYKYSPIAENCLSPVKIDDYVTRDFSADILVKDTCDRFFNDPENICELRNFAAKP